MLKSTIFLFSFLLFVYSNAQSYENPHDYFDGMGWQNDPFLIQSVEDLNNLRLFANSEWDDIFYEQTNDIDLDIAPYNSGLGWEPIGRPIGNDYDGQGFQANFNGNGYQITGLYINRPGEDYVGLFGYIANSAILKNVRIVNGDVTGRDHVGGVLGYNSGGSTIEDSFFEGFVNGREYVGGLVGRNTGAYVFGSFSLGLVQGEQRVGGLVGFNSFASFPQGVRSCYSNASVIADSFGGGLIGHSLNAAVSNNYSTGMIVCEIFGDGLVGLAEGTTSQNAWNKETSGLDWINPEGAGTPYTTAELLDPDVMHSILAAGMTLPNGEAYGYATWQQEPWPHNYPGKIMLSLESSPENSAELSGAGEYHNSTIAFVKSEAQPGFEFLYWKNQHDQVVSHADSFVFVIPYENALLTAHHDYVDFNLSAEAYPEGAGEVSIDPDKEHYHVGDQVTLNATSSGEYLFANWTDENGTVLSEDAEFVYTMPADDVVVTANFGVYTLQVNVSDTDKGVVEIVPDRPYFNPGEEIKIISVPVEGCFIANWEDDDENELGNSTVLIYTMPESNAVITAVFKRYFDVGYGTEENPWLIENAEQLDNVRRFTGKEHGDKHFTQINDIDLGVAPWNVDNGWKPIGGPLYANAFNGVYDGNGHSISNLYINRPEEDAVGLFGMLAYSVIKNVHLKDVAITGSNSVGGLVGVNRSVNSGLFIENSSVSGIVQGGAAIGGMVGESTHLSTISDCITDVMVSGQSSVGGFAGYASNFTSISRSSAYGDVSGTSSYTGGFIGRALSYTIIEDCYSKGSVTGNLYCGGFVGFISSNRHLQIINSFSTGNVVGENHLGGLMGVAEGNCTILNSYYNIDEVTINGENTITLGGIFGSQFDHWISNDLHMSISDYDETLVLDGDYYNISSLDGMRDVLAFIADEDKRFRLTNDVDVQSIPGYNMPYFKAAEFNGNGHAILGVDINVDSWFNVGFFGIVRGSVIRELGLYEAKVSGTNHVGGFVGSGQDLIIENSWMSGEVTGTRAVGGLVGNSRNVDISESLFTGKIQGDYTVGGLIGENSIGSSIVNSYASSSIYGEVSSGGLIGIGRNISIENSYAVSLTSNENIGGVIGSIVTNPDDVVGNYWDEEASSQEDCAGKGQGTYGRTTTEMLSQSTFANWDFDEIWRIEEGVSYPYLSWQIEPDTHNFPPERFQLTLEVSPEEGGTVTGGGEFSAGTMVRLFTQSAIEHDFIGWRDESDQIISTDDLFYYEMPSANTVLVAEYSRRDYLLTVNISPDDAGTVHVDSEKDSFYFNERVLLTADPAEGYRFVKWTNAQGNDLGWDEIYEVVMPAGDYVINANFELIDFSFGVNIVPPHTGLVTMDLEQTWYNIGDEITLFAAPIQGYVFVNWQDADGNILGTDQEVLFTMPAGNVQLFANFTTANNLDEFGLNGIKVYPNPVVDVLMVESEKFMHQLVLFATTGELLLRKNDAAFKAEINMRGLSSGIYLLKIVTDDGVEVMPVLVNL
ncbi:InlB B-repeat-containing protein [Natronoflexus pectinivorans]|uniref:Putative secreted protein (Por secretion system target) n=1 Tax=Natronoflexus pectinivorans TaxID=682526 RepID=A0A4R2GPM4_9BACT|nr:GLUG motif-containing protein [Natronoflexus pectinivorans]TCO09766.1 putative secreted protein (Por secretion system target) [Natronoflexus pectinivorans]